ncbi:MAG: glycosyltransferase family 4 protein [Methanocellales archaeon]|nr:glycosyltransferase family 4 protein [Methanocellales archaeon]
MKILMVGKYFYPVLGGVELHMQNLAYELVKKGHDVEVFASNEDFKDEKLSTKDEIEGIKIRRFLNVFSLCRGILNSDCDVIHYHLFRKVYVDASIIAGKITGKPLVFTPHCVYPPQSLFMKVAKKAYDSSFGHLSLALVDTIVALTENDKSDIIAVGASPNKIEIVPNSIRFEKFRNLVSGESFRNKYGVDRFLLYVGRIDWNKGLEHVIQAMPNLKKLGLKFVIVGEDVGYRAKLDELIDRLNLRHDVTFTGKISEDMLFSAYAACTLFILPAFYEGLPTVVLEAMAYRKPVIAAKTGGTKYVIKHGHNGFLIEYGDPGNICDVVKEALDSDLMSIGENAKKDVEVNYTWEKSAEKIEQIYEGLLSRDLK